MSFPLCFLPGLLANICEMSSRLQVGSLHQCVHHAGESAKVASVARRFGNPLPRRTLLRQPESLENRYNPNGARVFLGNVPG